MNTLREIAFRKYDVHYLRGNGLTYDSLGVQSYRRLVPEYEACFGELVAALPEGSRILDIGCGLGFLLFWLENSRPGRFQLTGIDLSESQLTLARKYLPARIALVHGEATSFLQRNTESFGAAFCTDVLEHLESEDHLIELLELVKRSLLPRGLMICQVPNMANLTSSHMRYIDLTHKRGFTEMSLVQLLECVGFRECQLVRRKAADSTQWLRMLIEDLIHRAVHRICGFGGASHFRRTLIGIGKA